MSNPVKILVDSTCDIGEELIKKYNLAVLPLPIFLGEEQFDDGVNITTDDLFKFVEKTGKLPRTVAPNAVAYSDFWQKWLDEGYDIVHFNIGAGFSVTHNAAVIAAEEYPDRVFPVDSKNLSSGIGLLVLRAAKLAEEGKSAAEIAKIMPEITNKVRSSFVLSTIEYLWKGGRCSGVAALGANLLKIKPCIEVVDGKMFPGKKYRGKMEDILASYVEAKLKDRKTIYLDHIFVTHSYTDDTMAEYIRDKVLELHPFKEVFVTKAGCSICTHCGRGTLGILFMEDDAAEGTDD
ncbi:MAG: DegV family protein [Oscillospiraceae bacterium]|jgi:DegV family protein with EDD domain|nr:DegV family protein [Oscillospiraceae bacterium]